jgi:hypothetical protein
MAALASDDDWPRPYVCPATPCTLAHPPGALREHDVSEARAPLLECLAVGVSKRAKLGNGLTEDLPLSARQWTRYYEGYPENWADRLGGVVRDKESV